MGINACIYIKTKDAEEPDLMGYLPSYCSLRRAPEWAPESATHEIENPWRYYEPRYRRGPWPIIAAVLMRVFASPNVETVWYAGDKDEDENPAPFTAEKLLEFSKVYMTGG